MLAKLAKLSCVKQLEIRDRTLAVLILKRMGRDLSSSFPTWWKSENAFEFVLQMLYIICGGLYALFQ